MGARTGGDHAHERVAIGVIVRVRETAALDERGVEVEGLDAEELQDEEERIGERAGEAEEGERHERREGLCDETCVWQIGKYARN